jgi:cytochrome c553
MFKRIFRRPGYGVLALLICLPTGLSPVAALAQQGDPRALADACMSCHGMNGHGQGAIPSLAGVDKATLLKELVAFKAGTADATIMNRIARGYSDAELDALATYFSSVPAK